MFSGALQRAGAAYRRRVFDLVRSLLSSDPRAATALDFGSGDGWFAQQMRAAELAAEITCAEVKAPEACYVQPVLFDGRRLPFADRSFELGYTIDVLHHCDDPRESLRELLRCTSRLLLIKDYTYSRLLERLALRFLDELGNWPFGLAAPHHFQRKWEWFAWIEQEGFQLRTLIHPAPCHAGAFGRATNVFQFVAVWERRVKPCRPLAVTRCSGIQ
jgi:SAM-dependent methyltransferase